MQLEADGWTVETIISEVKGGITRGAALGKPGDIVAVLGGDGTIGEAYKGLVDSSIPLLVLATGTANVIARELGLPICPAKAAATLANGYSLERWDVGHTSSIPAVFALSAGFDAEAVRILCEQRDGPLHGRISYLFPAIKAITGYKAAPIRIEADGVLLDGEFTWMLALNSKRYGGDNKLAPHADPTDGHFELVALRSSGVAAYLRYGITGLMGKLSQQEDAVAIGVKKLRAWSDGEVPVQIDGEAAGYLPLELIVKPGACTFVVPSRANDSERKQNGLQ